MDRVLVDAAKRVKDLIHGDVDEIERVAVTRVGFDHGTEAIVTDDGTVFVPMKVKANG